MSERFDHLEDLFTAYFEAKDDTKVRALIIATLESYRADDRLELIQEMRHELNKKTKS